MWVVVRRVASSSCCHVLLVLLLAVHTRCADVKHSKRLVAPPDIATAAPSEQEDCWTMRHHHHQQQQQLAKRPCIKGTMQHPAPVFRNPSRRLLRQQVTRAAAAAAPVAPASFLEPHPAALQSDTLDVLPPQQQQLQPQQLQQPPHAHQQQLQLSAGALTAAFYPVPTKRSLRYWQRKGPLNPAITMQLQRVPSNRSALIPSHWLHQHLASKMAALPSMQGTAASSSSSGSGSDGNSSSSNGSGGVGGSTSNSWQQLMKGLQQLPQLAGFAQLGQAVRLEPAASPALGVAFIPSNKALAAHLLTQSAKQCQGDALSSSCSTDPKQILLQLFPEAAAAAAAAGQQEGAGANSTSNSNNSSSNSKLTSDKNSSNSSSSWWPLLTEERAVEVIKRAAQQPAKSRQTVLRHVFPVYQPAAVDAQGPGPQLRTLWPDRSGALLLQNLRGSYLEVSSGHNAIDSSSSSSNSTAADALLADHQQLLLGGGVATSAGPVEVAGVLVYTLDGVLTETQEVVNPKTEALVRQALGMRPEDDAAADARRGVSLWMEPSHPSGTGGWSPTTPVPDNSTKAADPAAAPEALVSNLMNLNTLDQWTDVLPDLLQQLSAGISNASGADQQHFYLQDSSSAGVAPVGQQQQGLCGSSRCAVGLICSNGVCPLEGLPQQLLGGATAAQLTPVSSILDSAQGYNNKLNSSSSSSNINGSTRRRLTADILAPATNTGAKGYTTVVEEVVAPMHRMLQVVGATVNSSTSTEPAKPSSPQKNSNASATAAPAPSKASQAGAPAAEGRPSSPRPSKAAAAAPGTNAAPAKPAAPQQAAPGALQDEAMAVLQWPRTAAVPPAAAQAASAVAGGVSAAVAQQLLQMQEGSAVVQLSGERTEQEVAFMTLPQLAELLSTGQMTPEELVQLFTSRITRYQSLLLTATVLTTALARQEASAAHKKLSAAPSSASRALQRLQALPDPATANSSTLPAATAATAAAAAAAALNSSITGAAAVEVMAGLLVGVPYGLKDVYAVPGYPTSWGLQVFRDRVIQEPSWVFKTLNATGGVLLAKTAVGELAWGEEWWAGTTRNPWDPSSGTCGSSAGSAAAVVAGLLPYAIGTETWGSILCPAITTGASAYRPTSGVLPMQQTLQLSASLDKLGVFCRQVFDCAAVVTGLAAKAPAGQLLSQQLAQSALQAYSQPKQAGGQLGGCVGYVEGADADFLDSLTSLGFCVKGPLPSPVAADLVENILDAIVNAETAVNFEAMWMQGLIPPSSYWYSMIMQGQLLPASAYGKAQRLRAAVGLQVQVYFQQHGISVLVKPPRTSVGLDGFASMVGLPEIVLPVGQAADPAAAVTDDSSDPAPPTVCLMSLAGADAAAVAVAVAYQTQTTWHLQQPPLPDTKASPVQPAASG